MRRQYDCTHVNVQAVKTVMKQGDMIALYGTGSADIRATADDIALFNGHTVTMIDQGFTGSPLKTATIRDLERGAWSMDRALNVEWEAERKTIYCSRSFIPELQAASAAGQWKGDVWLAEWEAMPTVPPHFTGLSIIGQQYGNLGPYDVSVIWDDTWPNKKSIHLTEVLSVTPYPGYIHAGWKRDPEASAYELLIVGAGGKGTGTSYVDKEFITTNAGQVILAPGWYIARVRALYGAMRGDWSEAKHFEVKPHAYAKYFEVKPHA